MTWVFTSKTRFYLHEDETLLDGLLRTGHNVEFQCRQGYCGSCRLRVEKNSHPVQYTTTPLATLADDEILPCCCRVQGMICIKNHHD